MHRLTNNQKSILENSFEDGNTDINSLYTDTRGNKISKSQCSEWLRHRKLNKEIHEMSGIEKAKSNKTRVSETQMDPESDQENESEEKKEIKKQSKPKVHSYNNLTGMYYTPKLDEYEIQKINELSGLAKSLNLIKNDFHEKLKKSEAIPDLEQKDDIKKELDGIHDFHKRKKSEDIEEIDEVFKIKTLDNCIGFFNDILISQLQLLCRVPSFQHMLRQAIDDINDLEDEEDEPYDTIEKLTPKEVEQKRPEIIVPQVVYLDDVKTSKNGNVFV